MKEIIFPKIFGMIRILLGLIMLYYGGVMIERAISGGLEQIIATYGGGTEKVGLLSLSGTVMYRMVVGLQIIAGIFLLLGRIRVGATLVILILLSLRVIGERHVLKSSSRGGYIGVLALIILITGSGDWAYFPEKGIRFKTKGSSASGGYDKEIETAEKNYET